MLGRLPLAPGARDAAPWIFLEANPEDVTPRRLRRLAGARRANPLPRGAVLLRRGPPLPRPPPQRDAGAGRGRDRAGRGLRHRLGRPHLRPARTRRRRPGGASWRRPWRSGRSTCRATSSRSTRAPASVSPRSGASSPRCPRESRPSSSISPTASSRTRATRAYEVSNFARGRDHESRHNRKYWDHTPYLGLGPSAHSLAVADAGAPPAARRWWNERRTPRWEGRVAAGERPVEGEETLGPKALATEAVMLGLRTTAGIDLDGFTARYGVDLVAANDALVARLVGRGPPRRARRRGGWPVAGADGVRAGRRRRHGRRVLHPAPLTALGPGISGTRGGPLRAKARGD